MAGKRAALPRASDFTGQFLKDWERLSRSGRFDMVRLKDVMLRLVANDGALPPERRDHPLQGEWKDHRECHVGGDFLLIYRLDNGAPKRPAVTFVGSVRGRGGIFVCDAVLRWPSDRLAKVELRRFTQEPRGPDDRRETTASRTVGQSR